MSMAFKNRFADENFVMTILESRIAWIGNEVAASMER